MDKSLARSIAYGSAVGDALGVPFEFMPRGYFTCEGMEGHGTHDQPAGTWSDDTALLLATLDSLATRGFVDVEDMRRRFEDWLCDGDYAIDNVVFDVGGATMRALESGVGQSGDWDNGNGSLMRILPMVLVDATDEQVRQVSAITHANPISTNACVECVRFARSLIEGHPDWPDLPESRDEVIGDGFVVHTLEAALWCLRHTDSYEECVLTAVNLGDDTDTTGCVAGGLAGIAYGYDAIPELWIETLRGKDIIDPILAKL